MGPSRTYDAPVRILLIEDERGIADFVEKALRAAGHQVDACTDGRDGERHALSTDVDLVILDRMLPGREGVEVLSGIHEGDRIVAGSYQAIKGLKDSSLVREVKSDNTNKEAKT